MKTCKYYFNGTEYDYQSLYDLVVKDYRDDLKSITDILFSEEQTKRESIIEKLDAIKQEGYQEKKIEGKAKDEAMLTQFDTEYTKKDDFTINEFLSSPECKVNGVRLYDAYDAEAEKKRRIEAYKKKGLTQEQAEERYKEEYTDRYSTMENDARLIHELINFSPLNGKAEGSFIEKAEQAFKEGQADRISYDVLRKFYHEFSDKFWKDKILHDFRGTDLEHSIKRGFNISADFTFDDEVVRKLTGHIDYLIVDEKGVLHLYNFVTTFGLDQDYAKMRYNQLKLLTLRRILQNNGIDTKNISLHNIPIYIEYDSGNKIKSINILNDKRTFINDFRNPDIDKIDYQLSRFIDSRVDLDIGVDDQVSERLKSIYTTIFPTNLNLDEKGLHRSIDKWIAQAPEDGEFEYPLVIKEIGQEGNWYEVYINGQLKAHIKSSTRKTNNTEIKNVVLNHIHELNKEGQNISYEMYRKIRAAYYSKLNSEKNVEVKPKSQYSINQALHQYLVWKDDKPEWEMLDQLMNYNILLFRKGNIVDVIYLSNEVLDREIDFGNGQHNLLGKVKTDITSKSMKGTYGNLSTMISMLILNEYLPKLQLNDVQFGKIKVLSEFGTQYVQQYNIEHIVNTYFNEVLKEVSKHNQDIIIKNNFGNAKFRDLIEDIIDQLNLIVDNTSMDYRNDLQEELSKLKNLSYEDKETELKRLLDLITTTWFQDISPKEILRKAQTQGAFQHQEAMLYKMVSEAYSLYSKQNLIYGERIEGFETWMEKPAYIPSSNARLIVNNYRGMLNAMSDDINDLYDSEFHQFIMDYYKEIGYTALENSTLGFQEKVYRNMFDRDENGKLTMYFKNPYIREEDPYYLTNPERKFLKKAIFLFNKYTTENFQFDSDTDPEFIEAVKNGGIHSRYLRVPLQRAASDTKLLKSPKNKLQRFLYYVQNKKNLLDELSFKIDEITREAKGIRESDTADIFNNMHVGNKFQLSDDVRRAYIQERGVDYFETNVEDLLIDVLGEAVEVDKTNRFLTATKAILLQLELMKQDYSSDNDVINKELEYISQYLKVNVFKQSLARKSGQKILGYLMPIRKLVVELNLAGNIIGFFRDVENGFTENFFRTLTKYQTNITKSDLVKAYKTFFSEAVFNNPMRVNLLNKLCTVYRISNTDLARITERLKTGRAGLSNYENWLYSTLRAPDFLHRMTLFIANCIHDGVIDPDNIENSALYIKDDKLVYDWRKDKRFKALAKGDKSDPNYNKELGLYYARIKRYNNEHPDRPSLELKENGNLTELPQPYTEGEIQSIKETGSNIYGDYDKSNKSLGEFHFIGLIFGMWTTWMNGITANMIMKSGQYSPNQKEWTQMEDSIGKLYHHPKNPYNIVHESDLAEDDERIPVYEQEDTISQGVIPTISSVYKYRQANGKGAIKEYLNSNPNVHSLIMKTEFDALVTLLIFLLYKLAIDPAYQDHKKQADGREFFNNVITQIIYKSTRASFDTFRGPINIFAYLANNMNSPVWQTPSSIINDTFKYVAGEKNFAQVLTHNTGFGRTFQDAVTMYKRDVIE